MFSQPRLVDLFSRRPRQVQICSPEEPKNYRYTEIYGKDELPFRTMTMFSLPLELGLSVLFMKLYFICCCFSRTTAQCPCCDAPYETSNSLLKEGSCPTTRQRRCHRQKIITEPKGCRRSTSVCVVSQCM